MTLNEYEQEFYLNLANGTPKRNGIRRAIDSALEKHDAQGALQLYYEFIRHDIFYGDDLQSVLIFPEYLAYFEEHEELHEQFQRDMMWSFKWICGHFYEFCQIPLEQIESIFNQYAAFCKKFNYSLHSYYNLIGGFIRYAFEPDKSFCGLTAKEAFKRKLKTPRDDISDCKACELDEDFRYYLWVEDDLEKALEIIKPVFSGKFYCSEVPEVTYSVLAEYYFEHGDLKNAVKYATKSYRMMKRIEGSLVQTRSIISEITAYKEPEKALKMLKEVLHDIGTNQNAVDCYEFFKAAYHVFLCLEKAEYHRVRLNMPFKDEPIYNEDGIYQISDLKDFMYDKAKFYAEKLDARNGNTLLRESLDKVFEFKNVRFRKPSKLDIPVLEYIDEYLDGDVLPPNFSLPRKKAKKGEPAYTDGAMDGITLLHEEPYSEELDEELVNFIRLAGNGKERLAVNKTDKYFAAAEKRMLPLIDNLQNFIIDHREELNGEGIYNYGVGLTVSAKNYEAVKMGLSILEIFSDYNEKLLEAIIKLAACNEFTIYCIWAVRNLENANKLIFKMAKNTGGWGKIHALNHLQADTDEIKEWVLYYGVHNQVYPGYSAIKCFEDANVREILANSPDIQQMQAIAYIILFLLEDGPTIGINAFDDKDDILDNFLENAKNLGYEDVEDENYAEIVKFAEEYRDTPDNDKEAFNS